MPNVGAMAHRAHARLAATIRRILIGLGMRPARYVILVVDISVIATQNWKAKVQARVWEEAQAMMDPWLQRSRSIGQSEEEQAALMDEFMEFLGRHDPEFLRHIKSGSQSLVEGGEMDANQFQQFMEQQRKQHTALLNAIQAEAPKKPAHDWMMTALGSIATAALVVVGVWTVFHGDQNDHFKSIERAIENNQVKTDVSFAKVDARFDKTDARFDTLNTKVEELSANQRAILQRLEDARLRVGQTK